MNRMIIIDLELKLSLHINTKEVLIPSMIRFSAFYFFYGIIHVVSKSMYTVNNITADIKTLYMKPREP